MSLPFAGNRKPDRCGLSGLEMMVYSRSKGRDGEYVSVHAISDMLINSKIIHMAFDDDLLDIYVETPSGELYIIHSGNERVYVENGCLDEWECELLKGDKEWQNEQRADIKAYNDYIEKRRSRFPDG